MGAVYIHGGAGIGKTAFCTAFAAHYKIPAVVNILKGIYLKNPYLGELRPTDRNLVYLIEYLKIHMMNKPERFIADSSLLQMLAWGDFSPETISYLGVARNPPDLAILVPLPPLAWYEEHIEYFTGDSVRMGRYRERGGIKKPTLSEKEVILMIYEQDVEIYRKIETMLNYLDWFTFIPKLPKDDVAGYQTIWEKQVQEVLIKLWRLLPDATATQEGLTDGTVEELTTDSGEFN